MTVVPSPDADLVDRKYLSQFATDQVGMVLQNADGALDPDGLTMTASMVHDVTGAVVFTRPAERLSPGTFAVTLESADTATPGPYTITFGYVLNGVADGYSIHFEVGSNAPDYDALPFALKQIVEQVWIRFADLYDSPLGGPHLQTYVQSHFGRNRIAQLLKQAIGRLNTLAMPHGRYEVDANFPVAKWGALAAELTYIEVIKHLRRSYVEIPDIVLGTAISRSDRRDYMARWGDILAEEVEDSKVMLDNFKMDHMGLGNVSVLVSGGAYGRFGPTAPVSGGAALARGYFAARRVF